MLWNGPAPDGGAPRGPFALLFAPPCLSRRSLACDGTYTSAPRPCFGRLFLAFAVGLLAGLLIG
jgi:hypothetical protein